MKDICKDMSSKQSLSNRHVHTTPMPETIFHSRWGLVDFIRPSIENLIVSEILLGPDSLLNMQTHPMAWYADATMKWCDWAKF